MKYFGPNEKNITFYKLFQVKNKKIVFFYGKSIGDNAVFMTKERPVSVRRKKVKKLITLKKESGYSLGSKMSQIKPLKAMHRSNKYKCNRYNKQILKKGKET